MPLSLRAQRSNLIQNGKHFDINTKTDCRVAPLLAMTDREATLTMKQGFVYILTSTRNTVLYTGVTSNLQRRIFEHRSKLVQGFTKKYNCTRLVYYEIHDDIESAIAREKQIKAGSREKKLALINAMNPTWADLYETL